jgi:hypothetical protein
LVRIWYVFASLNTYCVFSLRISGFSLRIFLWATSQKSFLAPGNHADEPRTVIGMSYSHLELYTCGLLVTVTGCAAALRTTHAAVVFRRYRTGAARSLAGGKNDNDGNDEGSVSRSPGMIRAGRSSAGDGSGARRKGSAPQLAPSDGVGRVRPIKALQATSVVATWCFLVGIACSMASATGGLGSSAASGLSLLILAQARLHVQ